MKNRKKVLAIAGDFQACGFFRILQPFRSLQKEYKDDKDIEFHLYEDVMPNEINSLELTIKLSEYDAVVVQRPASPKILGIMEQIKSLGKKLYIELDDALFNVHPKNVASIYWRPGTPSWNTLKRAIEIADKLILSTPELQTIYQRDDSNSVVFLNGIDLDSPIYSPENNRRHQLSKDKTIIGWAGSTSHVDSLRALVKPIKKIMSQRDDCIFALCSNYEFMEYFKEIPDHKKQYVKHRPLNEFPPVMSLFDINIAVTQPDLFNSGKSELKVLEAGVWGVPSVCTHVAPYVRFAKNSDGGCVTIYDNEVNDWVRELNKIIDNIELRREMSEKTVNTIKTIYDIKEINKKRLEFFKSELL